MCGLCVRVWARPEDDLVLIYAEPGLEDLSRLLADEKLVDLVTSLMWESSGTSGKEGF